MSDEPKREIAEVTEFSGKNVGGTVVEEKKTVITIEGVEGENVKERLMQDIRTMFLYRREVYDRSEVLKKRPFQEVTLQDAQFKSEAERLIAEGIVNRPVTSMSKV